MTFYEESFDIDVPDDAEEPLDTLISFYVHNGYRRAGLEGDEEAKVALTRGKPGAGWWSSAMTDLHTELVIDGGPKTLTARYRVEVKGQRLSEVDQSFWKREARMAERVLQGKDEMTDMRPREEERAEKLQNQMRSMGLRAAVGIFLVILILAILADRFGYYRFY